jgi:hypothetical protein
MRAAIRHRRHESTHPPHRKLLQAAGTESQIMLSSCSKHASRWALAALVTWPALSAFTGCQVEIAGQTLPSPYYLDDDIQYYAPGPEFKLAREAAAQKEQREAIQSDAQARGNGF